jgi:hypothetical protein
VAAISNQKMQTYQINAQPQFSVQDVTINRKRHLLTDDPLPIHPPSYVFSDPKLTTKQESKPSKKSSTNPKFPFQEHPNLIHIRIWEDNTARRRCRMRRKKRDCEPKIREPHPRDDTGIMMTRGDKNSPSRLMACAKCRTKTKRSLHSSHKFITALYFSFSSEVG